MSAPERIWAGVITDEYRGYTGTKIRVWGDDPRVGTDETAVEYVRADLLTAAQAEIARLTAEGGELRDEVERIKVGTQLQSTYDCIPQHSTQEAIARIIEPSAWKQFDHAMRPYIENRGARQDENPWYQLTWRLGIRTPDQCRDWFLNTKYDGSIHNTFVLHVRESLEKSDTIMGVLHTLAVLQPDTDLSTLSNTQENRGYE